MVEAHPLVLRLRSAGLKDLDPCNIDEVHNMWNAFSKAKMCIDGGDRLEYLSWRIYSREVLAIHASRQNSEGLASINPKPAKIDAPESESENASSASEEEWLSDTDGSATSESEDDEVPDLVKPSDNSGGKMTRKDASLMQSGLGTPIDSCHRMHRKISSVELQHLFSESRSPVNIEPKSRDEATVEERFSDKAADQREQIHSPKMTQSGQQVNGSVVKSCLKKSSSVSPEPTGSVHRARFASPQPVQQYDSYRSSTPQVSDRHPSPVVRGFSPSSISVSVGKQGLNDNMFRRSSTNSESELSPLENGKGSSSGSQTSNTSGKKMFYIGAVDSDTDSSTTGSPEHRNHKTKEMHDPDVKAQTQLAGKSGDATTTTTSPSTPTGIADMSDWDDTSDEEEDEMDDETTKEERQKEMFKERAVPTKPLLKRSLLSSLFVSKINDFPTDDAEKTKDATMMREDKVSAPVDILLGAPLAPHFPLPEHARVDIDTSNWSNAVSNGTDLSSQAPESSRHRHSSNGRSFSESSLHITTRPEMYRASTDTRVHRRSSNEVSEQSNWAHQHEDIYDPMNYHSRGW